MSAFRVIGLAYSLSIDLVTEIAKVRVSGAWCLSSPGGVIVSAPRQLVARLPDPAEYVEETFGTSETRGILGGVQHRLLAAQSEGVERAIGDVVSVAFAEIFDADLAADVILVLGPVFPKLLGRVLSYRPRSDIKVAWVTPLAPPPEMLHYWRLLLPVPGAAGAATAWSYESLLGQFVYPQTSGRGEYEVQYLERSGEDDPPQIVLDTLREPSAKVDSQLTDTATQPNAYPQLPRILALAYRLSSLAIQHPQGIGTEITHEGLRYVELKAELKPEYLKVKTDGELLRAARGPQLYEWEPSAFAKRK